MNTASGSSNGPERDVVLLGRSPAFLRVLELTDRLKDLNTPVFISGESGTGKEIIARAIHFRGARRNGRFVAVNGGAIPDTLLESELFGHAKGAFTGALRDKPGLIEEAEGGTFFLDEVGDLGYPLQAKLLRVLQEREFEPVGGSKTERVDVRCILATNQDLAESVKRGVFRQDLYYRVNVVSIHLPPLRERFGDVPLLAEHFLKRHCERTGRRVLGLKDDAVRMLQMFSWPGNVRQLENVMERAVILTKSAYIIADDLPDEIRTPAEPAAADGGDGHNLPLKKALEMPEKEIILRTLKAHHGSRQATAEALGINRTTLYKKMKRFGIETEED